MSQQWEHRGVPTGGRFARSAHHEVTLPEEMTGEPDTDAAYCFWVAGQIVQAMRMRRQPTFQCTADGSILSHLEMGSRWSNQRRPVIYSVTMRH